MPTPLTKQFYSIAEVSQMLDVTAYTLRWWETFPMFNPNRTAKGTRRYTHDDIAMASLIKELLHKKGMKTDAAITYINKTHRAMLSSVARLRMPLRCLKMPRFLLRTLMCLRGLMPLLVG